MWTFHQSGTIVYPNGRILSAAYSGQPPHTGVTADEGLEGLGPIPCGNWTMVSVEEQNEKLGPFVIVLEPDEETRAKVIAYSRNPDSFRCHGEREEPPPGLASDGCIVAPRTARMLMWQSVDHALQVVP